jgi:hypothetical protein
MYKLYSPTLPLLGEVRYWNIRWSNTRYKVLCSIAILRKLQLIYTQGNAGNALTDNRALTAQTETKQGIESPNRDKTGSVGCVWPQRAYSAGREGRRGSKGSAVEAVGPPLAWAAYYRGLVIQHGRRDLVHSAMKTH